MRGGAIFADADNQSVARGILVLQFLAAEFVCDPHPLGVVGILCLSTLSHDPAMVTDDESVSCLHPQRPSLAADDADSIGIHPASKRLPE